MMDICPVSKSFHEWSEGDFAGRRFCYLCRVYESSLIARLFSKEHLEPKKLSTIRMMPDWLWDRLVDDGQVKPRSVGPSRCISTLKMLAKKNKKGEYVLEFKNGSSIIFSDRFDNYECLPARSGERRPLTAEDFVDE